MTTSDRIQEHIRIVEGAGGPKACIVGSRIRVIDIVNWHEYQRKSPHEIIFEFPQLTLADVYSALAYYWDHREELERKEAEDEAFLQEYLREHPSQLPERLRELQLAEHAVPAR